MPRSEACKVVKKSRLIEGWGGGAEHDLIVTPMLKWRFVIISFGTIQRTDNDGVY